MMRKTGVRSPSTTLEKQQPLPRKLIQVREIVSQLDELEKKLPEPWLPFKDPVVAEDLSDVHYLDPEKTICLVSRKYLHGLIESFNRMRFKLSELTQGNQTLLIESEKFKRESQLKGDYVKDLTQKLSDAEKVNGELAGRIASLSEEINKSAAQIEQIFQKQRIVRLPPLEQQSVAPRCLSTSAQTEYWSPKLEIIVQQGVVHVPRTPATEATERITQLIKEYEEKLEILSMNLAQKLSGVSDNVFDVKEWLQKNLTLQQENERLRAQMERFELEKEKARIWQEEVTSKMKSLEEEVCAPLPLPLVSDITVHEPPSTDEIQVRVENEYLRTEISNLRQQLLDKQLQMSLRPTSGEDLNKEAIQKAKRVLQEHMEDQVEQEGLMGKAVALSGKFRALTQFLYDVV